MNKSSLSQIVGLFSLLVFGACTQEKAISPDPVCFQRDVLPILIANCTQSSCHNSSDRAEGIDLTSYAQVISNGVNPGDYRSSKLYQVLITPGKEQMPKKPYNRLTAEQIGTIALWIEQGARNTACTNTTCDVSKVTYSKTVKSILDRSCNNCHGGNAPSANIDLTSYTSVKKYVSNGKLLGSINHDPGFSPMPNRASKLPACEISSVKEWIRLGALNN